MRADGLCAACPACFEFGEGPDSDLEGASSTGPVDSRFEGSLFSVIGGGLDGRAVRLSAKLLSLEDWLFIRRVSSGNAIPSRCVCVRSQANDMVVDAYIRLEYRHSAFESLLERKRMLYFGGSPEVAQAGFDVAP